MVMTFAREKRLLLGSLAFLSVLPLPFNEPRPTGVIGIPSLLLFLSLVVVFLFQANRDSEWRLQPWAMNVMGLCYVPLFLWDLRLTVGGNILRPMVHLLMFGLLAKLFSMNKEGQKWQVTVLIFFLFLGAMATSVHPLIVVYLIGFILLTLTLLFRFVQYHVLAAYPAIAPQRRAIPVRRLLFTCAALTLVLSVPLFALMPRLRAPYILGRGLRATAQSLSTGFQDEVSLDIVGRVRTNSSVALRLKMERAKSPPPLRFRGAAYDIFQNNSWKRFGASRHVLRPERRTFYRLLDRELRDKARIWLEPLGANNVILPTHAVSIEIPGRLYADGAGSVTFATAPKGIREYRVGLAAEAALVAAIPSPDRDTEPSLDRGGISARIEALAGRVVGSRPPTESAELIERHLVESYEYTLDFVGRNPANPIDDFLFQYRSGHCEYFATAMVLMLRSQGIPARFVTGFLGTEMNPLEDYFVVRQSNAHAWVEAYLPEQGWVTFDPTPPAGRPGGARPSLLLMLRQSWDYLQFRWDRYVMAYGSLDQLGLLRRFRQFWRGLKREATPEATPESSSEPDSRPSPWSFAIGEQLGRFAVPVLLLSALSVLLFVVWRSRSRFTVTLAYRDLRRLLAKRDSDVNETTAPMTLYDRLVERWPESAQPAGSLIQLYLRESYAGHGLADRDTLEAKRSLQKLRVAMRARGPGPLLLSRSE